MIPAICSGKLRLRAERKTNGNAGGAAIQEGLHWDEAAPASATVRIMSGREADALRIRLMAESVMLPTIIAGNEPEQPVAPDRRGYGGFIN
jgi:hypothetical protein